MDVFDIIGPVMVGPSSSHTAGAVRIGNIVKNLLGEQPVCADILFAGSFAKTYKGHGTDKAVTAGLLGMLSDDPRIPDSLSLAVKMGLDIHFTTTAKPAVHPNTMRISASGIERHICVTGCSIGGGNVKITRIDELEVEFDGKLNTLVVPHHDTPGVVAAVTNILAQCNINIANMRVYRARRSGNSSMIIEADQEIGGETVKRISNLQQVGSVIWLKPVY